MKIILFASIFVSTFSVRLCYGQRFTYDLQTMMTYLPRTADDFHSKYYDTDLESAMSFASLYFRSFEGIPVMKHDGSIKSLSIQLHNTNVYRENAVVHDVKFTFDSSGILSSCTGRSKGRILIPCVPFSSKVGHGINLLLDNDETVEFTRDSQNRVIEAQVRQFNERFLVFRYSYQSNSRKIATIKGYKPNGDLLGEVLYSYNNGRLSALHFKGYNKTYKGVFLTAEAKKTYNYDGHGNLSKIDLSEWHGIRESGYRQIYTFENQYNDRGLLVLSKIVYCHISNSGRRAGQPSYSYGARKYAYDNHGNWIKIESNDNWVLIREFEYN